MKKKWEEGYASQTRIIRQALKVLIEGHVDEGSLFEYELELKKDIKRLNTFLLELLAEQII